MKTLKNKSGEFKRVSEKEADLLTQHKVWSYASKSEWKDATRPKKVEKAEK